VQAPDRAPKQRGRVVDDQERPSGSTPLQPVLPQPRQLSLAFEQLADAAVEQGGSKTSPGGRRRLSKGRDTTPAAQVVLPF
jgi:hypothetical protein